MGVQGLWTLLEPVGRRVNIEAIANKRLAVGRQGPTTLIRWGSAWLLKMLPHVCRRFNMAVPVHEGHAG